MNVPGAHTHLGFGKSSVKIVCIIVGTQLTLNKHLLTISYVHAIYMGVNSIVGIMTANRRSCVSWILWETDGERN